MTRIKFCGLSRICDIESANALRPDYVGFIFVRESRRCVTVEQAAKLRRVLDKDIRAVGVFVNEEPHVVAELLTSGIIDIAQLHGDEDEAYIAHLARLTDKPIIKAFRVRSADDIAQAEKSTADGILLDSGAGTGTSFDWSMLAGITRPYFLAGGLSPDNAGQAVRALRPFAVDVSSGIETDGQKDNIKMASFADAVRKEDRL